jgi:serine/threonine protein kinase
MAELIGQSFGRYHILEKLGEGGMAVVYKAYDTRLERNVAVKVITPSREHSEKFLKRFEREARALAKLSHPNIVGVIDYGEQNGLPYLVMEYIPAGTLKQKLGKLSSWQDSAHLLLPIARALAYAHSQGVVHRDVKPSNILLTQSGEPMLTDFGIAKLLEAEETVDLTGTGVGVGTPEYMAPEQARGQSVDARADIYSLGVVFYEMVTGRKPYQADTPMAVVWKLASEPLPRPTTFVPKLPEAIERVILKALAKDVQDRFQRMTEFASTLESLSQGRKASVPRIGPTRLSSSRLGLVLAGVLITSALLAAGFINRDRLFWPPEQVTVTPTALAVTAIPVVELSAPLSDFQTEIYFEDDFNNPSLIGWQGSQVAQVQDGYLHFEGDESYPWAGVDRRRALDENQVVNITFKHSPNSEYEIYVQTGQWDTSYARRWGIYGNSDSFTPNVYEGSEYIAADDWLKGNLVFQSNHWYTLSLRIGQEGEFAARIWDRDDPTQFLAMRQNLGFKWAGKHWFAHMAVNKGNLDVDSYQELIISNLYTGDPLPTPTPRLSFVSTQVLEIDSQADWLSTGIEIEEPQIIKLEASNWIVLDESGIVATMSGPMGLESCKKQDLQCTLPEARLGALIGRIGDGEPFVIGTYSQLTADASGELFLRVNDIEGKYLDNRGNYRVKITVQQPE